MKGVLFNVTEEVVTDRFGQDTWDDILEAAGVDGAYTALGQYDDAELVAVVSAAATVLDTPVPDVLRLLGRGGFDRLASRYGHLLDDHTSSRSVLAALNPIIHPQVLRLYPGASVPEFDFFEGDDATTVLGYRSERGLCHLAEGLVLGLGDYFGEVLEVTQPACRLEGGDECRLVVHHQTDA